METGRKDCHSWLGEWALKGFSEQERGREFADCQRHSRQRHSLYKDSGEGKAGSVWYNKSIWGNSQRCFHSTPEIEGTPSTLKVFRDWWAEKDKQIRDYHVIITMIRVPM